MKSVLFGLFALISLPALSNNSYDCLLMQLESTNLSDVSNNHRVEISGSGLITLDDLRIEFLDKEIVIQHVIDGEVKKEQKENIDTTEFRFSSNATQGSCYGDVKKSIYITCSKK